MHELAIEHRENLAPIRLGRGAVVKVAIGQRVAVVGAGMSVEAIGEIGAPCERPLERASMSGVAKRSRSP